MRKSIIGCLLAISALSINAQNYKEEFLTYLQQKDTLHQIEVLQAWEQKEPNDAELYTCYANYYMSLAHKEVVYLTKEQPDGEALVFNDSLGNTAGYISSSVVCDKVILQKGIDKLDKGIALYPNRLDMRFGKVYLLGLAEQWKTFTDNIMATIQYSAQNKNNWTWADNQPYPDGEEGFLSALQDYQVQLFDTEDEALFPYMRAIAQEVLKFYPKHVESLSNIAITYMLSQNVEEALTYLLQAEKYTPDDTVVLGNIAYCYELTGKEDMAKAYRDKVAQLQPDR
jgi:tetratricopeptide (TPR) repeat protein